MQSVRCEFFTRRIDKCTSSVGSLLRLMNLSSFMKHSLFLFIWSVPYAHCRMQLFNPLINRSAAVFLPLFSISRGTEREFQSTLELDKSRQMVSSCVFIFFFTGVFLFVCYCVGSVSRWTSHSTILGTGIQVFFFLLLFLQLVPSPPTHTLMQSERLWASFVFSFLWVFKRFIYRRRFTSFQIDETAFGFFSWWRA